MTALGEYLTGQGFTVSDASVPLGRDSTWTGVGWIFVHHTASTCDPRNAATDAKYIKSAMGRFPPLSQLMLGRDLTVYVTTRPRPGDAEPGRASHAGAGVYRGIPRDRGNECSIGIEVQCKGTHPLATHPDSYAVLIRLCAALCRRYGLSARNVIGHKEYSSQGKIDPRDDCDVIRADVAAALMTGGEETVRYLSVKGPKEGTPTPVGEWTLLQWPREDSDDWNGHPDGYGRVDLPAGGIVSGGVTLTVDQECEARITRGPKDGSAAPVVIAQTDAGPGPFVLALPPAVSQDSLWVEVRTVYPGTVEFAQLRLTVADRAG